MVERTMHNLCGEKGARGGSPLVWKVGSCNVVARRSGVTVFQVGWALPERSGTDLAGTLISLPGDPWMHQEQGAV
jgi:hypothetical protein